MSSYEYVAMKFANQWISSEHVFHISLNQNEIPADMIAKALHHFQVARTFKNLEITKNREFIAESLIECSKYLTKNNFQNKVEELAEIFDAKFNSRNLSAASKLLWLRKRSPIIIYDKWAKIAIEKMGDFKIHSYGEYCKAWQKNYEEHQSNIKSASKSITNIRSYSALRNKSSPECKEIVESNWFNERVFDMHLLECGKSN